MLKLFILSKEVVCIVGGHSFLKFNFETFAGLS